MRKPMSPASARPAPAPALAPAHLTPRELEVAAYLGDDASPADIGRELGIGRETVRVHIKRIQHKLGVRSRHAAALALHKQGIQVTQLGN